MSQRRGCQSITARQISMCEPCRWSVQYNCKHCWLQCHSQSQHLSWHLYCSIITLTTSCHYQLWHNWQHQCHCRNQSHSFGLLLELVSVSASWDHYCLHWNHSIIAIINIMAALSSLPLPASLSWHYCQCQTWYHCLHRHHDLTAGVGVMASLLASVLQSQSQHHHWHRVNVITSIHITVHILNAYSLSDSHICFWHCNTNAIKW